MNSTKKRAGNYFSIICTVTLLSLMITVIIPLAGGASSVDPGPVVYPGTPVVTYVVHVYPPPASSFTFTPSGGTAPLLVTFTDISTSAVPITSWAWDFGDGTTSPLENPPVHTYALPGMYTVKLTVIDGNGARDTRTVQGAVNVLPVAVPVPTVSPAVTTVVPVVTTVAPVYILPVSDFTVTPSSGTAPLLVTFTDISRSAFPLSSWVWDFGDGTTSTLQNPVHTYSSRGLYTVILTITDNYGEKHTKTVLGAVNILQEVVPVTPSTVTPAITNVVPVYSLPVSSFTSTPSSGTAPLLVTFTDISTSSVPITNWVWDFGDGTTSTLQNPPVHTYSAAGTYPITLDVTDAKGNPSMFADSIKVNPPAALSPSGQMAPVQSPEVSTTPVSLIVQPCWGIAWLFIIICVALLAFIWRKKRS